MTESPPNHIRPFMGSGSHHLITLSRDMSRRSMVMACALLASGTLAATEDRADPVLIEWSTASAGSSVEHVRLRIFASGIVQAWPAGHGERMVEQRTPEEAKELSDSIVRLVREQELSTESIVRELREQSKQTGLSFQISEAADTLITVTTGQGRQSIRCAAVSLLAERFPEARRLQEFATIERRLGNLNCVVQCGGRDGARRLCVQANDRLLSEHPKAAVWTIDDLTMVRMAPSGGRFVQFRRHDSPTECWTTCITETPGFAPRVSVIPPASQAR